ncbi:MaoC family dehydratase N-terminal domain-containing protein [Streptomyces sulphureus]|uniref:MaoC family dehydratase N-terminal domain-containing protein n=1 Tax=Streptomyces sulphureus TaxID=47758 RepID=UPI000477972D|nr:MaoC family dehydratase N-terminal domain-containing protein [Streptomyces sulphureus]
MALDKSFEGRSYPPGRTYEVGREKIREFAEAIGDANPAYTDPEVARALGYADVIAPPTFVFSLTFREAGQALQDPTLQLDYGRVVHGDQKFHYHRPVLAGDRLSVTSTIDSIKSMSGNDILDIRGDVYDSAGEPVVTAVTKVVVRGPESDSAEGK